MPDLIVAIGWFIGFAVVTAVVCGIIWQVQPRSPSKGESAPAHH